MIRLRTPTTTPTVFGMSFFLYCSFRGSGCGKAMLFDDFLRRDRRVAQVRTRTCDIRSTDDSVRKGMKTMASATLSKKQSEEILRALKARCEKNLSHRTGLE